MSHLEQFTKKFLFVFPVLLLLSFLFGRFVSTILAQDSPIPPGQIPCSDIKYPEFSSLRPYQANPCDPNSSGALFCGNQLVLQDKVSSSQGSCSISGGRINCTVTKTKTIAINLSGADLPILGNTEDTANSTNTTSSLNDAEKTNQYASWYLNGVNGRAENQPIDTSNSEEISKTVDFAGPLNKLLPWDIQAENRVSTIERAEKEQHNQVVACSSGLLAGSKLEACTPSSSNPLRLKDWEGHIAPKFLTLPSTWDERIPPLRKDFDKQIDYQKAYNEWRGQSCLKVTIPIINKETLACVDNPLRPNIWADAFSYIPLSSTEDKKGQVETSTLAVQPASDNAQVRDISFTNQEPAPLFFAHTEEVAGLSSLLQSTYLPQGESGSSGVSGVSPSQSSCDLVNIRTNPGDNLFAGEIKGDLTYTVDFSCDAASTNSSRSSLCSGVTSGTGSCVPDSASCNASYGQLDCGSGNKCGVSCSNFECTKDVNINLSLLTQTPNADELWSRTVAGPAAVFKRIFPRVGEGGAVLGILDIPAATKVSYTSEDGTPVVAGNPENQRAGEGAELYFPHIGGISEYFLKGIQTILRPKGFGEQIISGEPGTFTSSGDINCDQNAPDVSVSNLLNKDAMFQLALDWVSGKDGNHVKECYNDVVKRARAAGVNTALTFWMWLHESNASNYDSYDKDFGVISGNSKDFVDQIDHFFRTAKTYTSSSPQCAGQSVNSMQAFLYIYATGTCDPNAPVPGFPGQTAESYYQAFTDQLKYLSNCSTPKSPTDTSCPK